VHDVPRHLILRGSLDASCHAVILPRVKRSIAALLLFVQLLVALVVHVPRPSPRAHAIDVALAGAQITRSPERASGVAKPDAVASSPDATRLPLRTFTRSALVSDVIRIDDVSITVPRTRGPPAYLVSRS